MPEINIEENRKKIIALLKSVPVEELDEALQYTEEYLTTRDEIQSLLNYLEASDFYTAPASTQYHLNVKGGLVQHNLNCYNTLLALCKLHGIKLSNRTAIITGILHDVNNIDYYKDNILKNGKVSGTKPYTTEDLFPIGHGEKSVILLQKYITLTEQEIMMIRWHMGVFDRSFMQYESKLKEICPEAILLHMADWLASVFVDPTYEQKEETKLEDCFKDKNEKKDTKKSEVK